MYFDNAATTQISKSALRAMTEAMEQYYGNPSSLHIMGHEAEKQLKQARGVLAQAMACEPKNIVFTSGGTESNNLALFGVALRHQKRGKTIIVSQIEHPSVANAAKKLEQMDFTVQYLPTLSNGQADADALKDMLTPDVTLVSVMGVNNETGVLQDTEKIYALAKANGTVFHCDMVQGFGRLEKPVQHADVVSVSGHKIHGPKGVGALYIKDGILINPLIYGGGQEQNLRSGTENMTGIMGFAAAAQEMEANRAKYNTHMAALCQRLCDAVTDIPDCIIHGQNTAPHIVNISFLGVKSEVLLHTLESHGIMVGAGSACSSHKPQPSPTLTAMGCSKAAIESSLRFSFCHENTADQVDKCIAILKQQIPFLRKYVRK